LSRQIVTLKQDQSLLYSFEEANPKFKQLAKAMEELRTYIQNNGHLISNDGERIATARPLSQVSRSPP
jgi:hypothetical protein